MWMSALSRVLAARFALTPLAATAVPVGVAMQRLAQEVAKLQVKHRDF